ncbi:MAG: imidazolonepropionase [candidate division Zixibacteria bacterium]|nr:imidazolonepropionase [candidate division Zixibacteria bacterium]
MAKKTTKKTTLLIENIGQLVTMRGPIPRRGKAMSEIGIIENAFVAVSGSEITVIGHMNEITGNVDPAENCSVISGEGRVVTPGLIDPHTHPVFARTRELEFEMRLAGKTYMEIAEAGGGIRSSVRHLREIDDKTLYKNAKKTIDTIMSYGVTSMEAKSGYGLSTEAEIKMLKVIQRLNEREAMDLYPTFLGAHEVPDEYRDDREAYIDLVINEMIPAVAEQKLAQFCDIFCEEGVFTVEESRKILVAAKAAGMIPKLHADELKSTGGAELAVELGAISADHLGCISDKGIEMMAGSDTIAVLLPGTTFALALDEIAPARKMIDQGVAVALSTDCNPGSSMTESLPMIITLAALKLKMTAAEALSATTVNAACAIGMGDNLGRIEIGLPADIVVWDMRDYRELPYHYGVNLVEKVIKNGKIVVGA